MPGDLETTTIPRIYRTYHVATIAARNALTNIKEGELCLVDATQGIYRWTGLAWETFILPQVSMLLVRKTADEVVNNSDAAQNDDELFFAMAANEVWEFTIVFIWNSTGTANFKTATAAPAGSTTYKQNTGRSSTGTYIIHPYPGGDWSGYNNPYVEVILRGIVINGANAGNFVFQWAQQTAEVSDTTVYANSCIIAHKIA